MMNGRLEEVNEGGATHQCQQVYRHDKDFTERVNVWVKWTWDNKYELVSEDNFVRPWSRRQRSRTNFLRTSVEIMINRISLNLINKY